MDFQETPFSFLSLTRRSDCRTVITLGVLNCVVGDPVKSGQFCTDVNILECASIKKCIESHSFRPPPEVVLDAYDLILEELWHEYCKVWLHEQMISVLLSWQPITSFFYDVRASDMIVLHQSTFLCKLCRSVNVLIKTRTTMNLSFIYLFIHICIFLGYSDHLPHKIPNGFPKQVTKEWLWKRKKKERKENCRFAIKYLFWFIEPRNSVKLREAENVGYLRGSRQLMIQTEIFMLC